MAEHATTRGDGTQVAGVLRRVAALRWPARSRRDDALPRHWPDDLDIAIPPPPDV